MATDLARLSFDPARHYTGVVRQQGRVTLEADENEQRIIDAEERRAELIDIVGPCGTPDDGYLVTAAGDFDVSIGPGTMYVGGQRVVLDEAITFQDQPQWLDRVPIDRERGAAHVLLEVVETDVTAVEDPALYEPALGGPDSAARTTLLQRIELLATDSRTCAGALAEDEKRWAGQGLVLDPDTMQLASQSRLLVSWLGDPAPADPCEPNSAGGYLGAENQLIRVQVVATDPNAGTVDLLWGYDNASFLYRVTPDASADPLLTLQRSPVDDFHRPRAGQAVQALRSTAPLASTDGVVEGYVAALTGTVGVLATPYDPDTRTVQFPSALPPEYTDADATPQLYLRVWEQLITGVSPGTPLTLDGTGMQITLTAATGSALHLGDFWSIGVRPGTPTAVYPARYLRTPQPPDGPRMWVCPLAVVEWQDGRAVVDEDCRHHFGPLGGDGGTGCCALELRPSDARGSRLQTLIEQATTSRRPGRPGRVTICLAAGRYELEEPIELGPAQSDLELHGCAEGAVLAVAPGAENRFAQGMIVGLHADNVTISGIEFELPQVDAALAKVRGSQSQQRAFLAAVNAVSRDRYVSIGVRPVHCAVFAVTDCLFRFTVGPDAPTAEDEATMPRAVFGVGVFAGSECWGLRLEGNRFLHDPPRAFTEGDQTALHALVGYLLTPTVLSHTGDAALTERFASRSVLRAVLDDALIRDNEFGGLTVGVAVMAELGDIRVEDNRAHDCFGGFWFLGQTALAYLDLAGVYQVPDGVDSARAPLADFVLDPALLLLGVLGRTYPIPGFVDASPGTVWQPAEGDTSAAGQQAQEQWTREFLTRIAQDLQPSAAAPSTGARAAKATAKTTAAKAETPAQTDFNGGLKTTAKLINQVSGADRSLRLAHEGLLDIERGITAERGSEALRMRVAHNEVDRLRLGPEVATGIAFGLMHLGRSDDDTLVLSDNLLRGYARTAVTDVLGVSTATVTGNVIRNDTRKLGSIAVLAAQQVAITGNVLVGEPTLPTRPVPAPLDTWLPLNTVT